MQDDENADVFKTWYPPLEKTLSCLSKLYRCLEPTVFTGLAQVTLPISSFVASHSVIEDMQSCLTDHLFSQEAVEVCSLSIQVSKLENKIFITLTFDPFSAVVIFIDIIC